MARLSIGFLHPGAMGASLAASVARAGHRAWWAREGRSARTAERAQEHGLSDAGTVESLSKTCDVIVSVCPPHAAEEVAARVLSSRFGGLYLDANAISPGRARRIGEAMTRGGVTFVDGAVIGPPAWKPHTTRLYLSGPEAPAAAACFSSGLLETSIVGREIGNASALKMCYSAYRKGSLALLYAILAASETLGVRPQLEDEWRRSQPGLVENASAEAATLAAKAWRFAGEMEEVASTFEEAGMHGGFHRAAADVCRRLAGLKETPGSPSLEELLKVLLESGPVGKRAGGGRRG